MKIKRLILSAIILPLTLLSGCSLAQPEKQTAIQDKFIGFHAVVENWDMDAAVPDENGMTPLPTTDRSHWTEYGAEDFELDDFGTVSFPREVLFAEYDEETNTYIFNGMEGINAFSTTRIDGEGTTHYSGYNGLSAPKLGYSDTLTSLEGTIYMEAGKEDHFVTLYKVFETEDGRIYLDGTGDSYGGAGGFGMTHKTENKTRIGDEEIIEAFEITVQIESIYPVDTLEVMQCDKNNLPISSEIITEFGENMSVSLHPETHYILLVETDKTGESHRSVIDRNADPELQAHHFIRYLSESGAIVSASVAFISE